MVAVAAVVVALAVPAVLAAAAEPAGLAASIAAVAVVQQLVAAAAAAEHLRLRHTALGRSAANRLSSELCCFRASQTLLNRLNLPCMTFTITCCCTGPLYCAMSALISSKEISSGG